MPEIAFNLAQLGRQAGTFLAPGASVAATNVLPVTERVIIDLDRASRYPQEDYGRNAANHAGRGYHGVRGASLPLTGELTFEQIMHVLEMHYAGSISPTGSNPYTWVYPLEAGAPTLKPYTVETGSEIVQDQYEAVGVLIDELTLGFDDLDAPGAHPWTFNATCLALSRAQAAITAALSSTAVETLQGHLSVIKWGTTATAFAALGEEVGTLISFSVATQRHLVRRPYGGTTDVAGGYGFTEKTTGTATFKVKVNSTTQADFHDAWNSAGGVLGEKRARISAVGSGTKVAHLDFRGGMTAVGVGDRDGESVYEVTAELVDDTTLTAPAAWTVINAIAGPLA